MHEREREREGERGSDNRVLGRQRKWGDGEINTESCFQSVMDCCVKPVWFLLWLPSQLTTEEPHQALRPSVSLPLCHNGLSHYNVTTDLVNNVCVCVCMMCVALHRIEAYTVNITQFPARSRFVIPAVGNFLEGYVPSAMVRITTETIEQG